MKNTTSRGGAGGTRRTVFARYTLGVLLALEVLMSFTFLGYIHIDPISVTTAYIPVLVTAAVLDTPAAAAVGAVFGAASLYKASAYYVTSMDRIFSPLQSGAPVQSLLLSVGTRALFGLVMGVAFALGRRSQHFTVWRIFLSAIATRVHALFVYTAMGLFFPECGFSWKSAFALQWCDAVLALFCAACVELVWRIYNSEKTRRIAECINGADNNPYIEASLGRWLVGVIAVVLVLSIVAADYFSQRAAYMLDSYGFAVPDHLNSDLLHLQVQFVAATLALVVMMAFLMMAVYRYMSFQEYLHNLDALTGLMGRRTFVYLCNQRLRADAALGSDGGWFLLLDVDHFKYINDSFGHPAGDRVLRQFARILKKTFAADGFDMVGRIGGDEFAVLLDRPLTEEEVAQRLDVFLADLSSILQAPNKVTASIGGYRFAAAQDFAELLEASDPLLYQAKKNGRDGYVLGGE